MAGTAVKAGKAAKAAKAAKAVAAGRVKAPELECVTGPAKDDHEVFECWGQTNFLLKVELLHITPPVARLMVVPADASLWMLHNLLQVVMGWHNVHQYGFNFGGTWYLEDPEDPDDGLPVERFTLGEVVARHGASFLYVYDFGDGWEHDITVLDQDHPRSAGAQPVECLDGVGACPIEDVGGPGGYQEFLDAMADRKHPEHVAMKEWLAALPEYGPRHDPYKFDRKKVNRTLASLLDPDAKAYTFGSGH